MKVNKTLEIESRYNYYFDVLAIKIADPYEYQESIELEEGIILDFDTNNIPVAIEILDASKVLNVPDKQYLSNRKKIKMKISISEKVIEVHLNVNIEIHNKKEIMSFNSLAINDINAPVMETELASV